MLSDLFPKDAGLIHNIVFLVVLLNVCLSAVNSVLGAIKDKTASDADNKLSQAISGLCGMLQKVLDFLSANQAH